MSPVLNTAHCTRRVSWRKQGPPTLHACACMAWCTCRPGWRALLPTRDSLQLLVRTKDLLMANFWAILVVYACKDAFAFLLHRVSQRATNLGE